MENINYPFRSGAYSGALESLKFNREIQKLLNFDAAAMQTFKEIIEKLEAKTEANCVAYEEG